MPSAVDDSGVSEQIIEHFNLSKHDDETVIAECLSMLRLYSISAEDLFYKWEAYCLDMDIKQTSITLDLARNLKANIQEKLEKENRDRKRATPSSHAYTPRPAKTVMSSASKTQAVEDL